MNVTSSPSPSGPSASISTSEIRSLLVSELARVLATDEVGIEQEIQKAGGDLAIESLVAETILARMEQHLGRTLPGVADLEPEQINSVNTLVGLIERGIMAQAAIGSIRI